MAIRIPVIDALPDADVERQGEVWRLRESPGSAHICLQNTAGTYVWVPITFTDEPITATYDDDPDSAVRTLPYVLEDVAHLYAWKGVKYVASGSTPGRLLVEIDWRSTDGTSYYPARDDHEHRGAGVDSTALGSTANAAGSGVSIGQSSSASGTLAVAVGQFARATGNQSTAVGQGASALGLRSFAYGQGASESTDDTGTLWANDVIIRRSNGTGVTRIGVLNASGVVQWLSGDLLASIIAQLNDHEARITALETAP